VVVRAVDEGDLDVAFPQELRGNEATEAAAHDDHAVAPFRRERRTSGRGIDLLARLG
jgi:hypothetical protein